MAFKGFLKQSTAATLKLGPFLDSIDGITAEAGLTIAQADVRLSKNGGDMAQKNELTSCTHDELGVYDCPVDTTDTNALGRLQVNVAKSGAIPVQDDYEVISVAAWAALHGDTIAEESGVPAANAALVTKQNFMFAKARNKMTQTASTTLLRNDADSGTIATSTVSDDGTTFIRGELA